MAVTLVLRALGLGELITAVPALRALRRARPEDRLVLAAPQGLGPVVWLTDAVDELLPSACLSEFAAELPLHRRWLEPDGLRRAVNLQDRGPASTGCLQSLNPSELISHSDPHYPTVEGPVWDPAQHEIDRWCSLLEAYGISTDRTDLRLRRPDRSSAFPGATVIHPGGAFRARRWPPGRFADVARKLAAEGHRVVITGSASERKLCCWIADRAGLDEGAVIAGRTDLSELAAVIAEAGLVICGDTGTGHLATALDTPSVLLFGPTPPSRWDPTGGASPHLSLWAGHVGDPLGTRPDPGLLQLQVGQVLDTAHQVLQTA